MPNELLPTNIGFGTVVGRFGSAPLIAGDADGFPDFSPATGLTVTFTPSTAAVIDATASPAPVTIEMVPIVCGLDSQGYLVGGDGQRGVKLIATDDTDINPSGWTYLVTFLRAGAKVAAFRDFSMSLPQGVTKDIALTIPVPSSSGVSLSQAQAAEAAAVSAASAASAAAAVATTAADNAVAATVTKVNKGELVFNVKDYAAAGNWSSGTTGTDDTAAINAAFTAAAAAVASNPVASARVLFPGTTGNGYKTLDTLTVPPGVSLDMLSPIIYCGPTGRAALIVGSATPQFHRVHTIRLRRYATTNWLSEADAGVVIRNQYYATITIAQCDNFTVGATLIGDTNNGFSYNHVTLGGFVDNKIALDLTNDTGGWCNENDFYGGRFTVSSTTNTTLDRVGVRITSRVTYYNNSNIFYKPAFELKGQSIAGVSTCLLAEYASMNRIYAARHESNNAAVLVQKNGSVHNWADFAYTDLGSATPVMDASTATAYSGGVSFISNAMTDNALRTVHKVDALHLKACYYDGGTTVNVPGLTIGTSGTTNTDARAQSLLVIAANYLEVPNSRVVGFYMSTRNLKTFTVLRDAESGFGGRIILRTYDSTGTILTTAGSVRATTVANNPPYATSYGGSFRTQTDSNLPVGFNVSVSCDYVFIGIAGGSSAARIRALSVATTEPANPATWLAFPDNNQNYATTPPAAGTWAVGRVVVNATPAAGTAAYWVCTAAGTPGTWTPVYAGTITAPADIQVFTSAGTWTKPVGTTTTRAILMGGGGPGGSGRRGAAGTVRCGGGGGGGGARTEFTISTALLPSSVSVAVGAAGVGGAAVTSDDTSGGAGTSGGASTFGSYARAGGGGSGGGGTASTGTAGAAGIGQLMGGVGSAASATGGVGGSASSFIAPAAAGGAGGGGITSANSASNGGLGVVSASVGTSSALGGVVDGASPGSAAAGVPNAGLPGGSGGGGAASITTAAQTGAAGGIYGGGGAGGGAALNGNSSGAGGDGAPGIVVVIST